MWDGIHLGGVAIVSGSGLSEVDSIHRRGTANSTDKVMRATCTRTTSTCRRSLFRSVRFIVHVPLGELQRKIGQAECDQEHDPAHSARVTHSLIGECVVE